MDPITIILIWTVIKIFIRSYNIYFKNILLRIINSDLSSDIKENADVDHSNTVINILNFIGTITLGYFFFKNEYYHEFILPFILFEIGISLLISLFADDSNLEKRINISIAREFLGMAKHICLIYFVIINN